MPRPTQQLSTLPPFSRQVRQSFDESFLPSIPHPPSPPSAQHFANSNSTITTITAAAAGATGAAVGGAGSPVIIPITHRYSTIPLISSVANPSSTDPNAEPDAFYNNLNTGVYNSLSRIPSYRLPSPVSLPSRHNSRIQRDRGMTASPVSSISTSDAPVTNRYAYLVQPLSGIPQSPSPPDMPQPPPPPPAGHQAESFSSTNSHPTTATTTNTATMGAPPVVQYYSHGQSSSRAAGLQLPPINESTSNLQSSSSRLGTGYVSQDGAPTSIHILPLQDMPPAQQHQLQHQPHHNHIQHAAADPHHQIPSPPRNAFQRAQDFAGRRFDQLQRNINHSRRQTVTRSRSLSQFVRRHRRAAARPPTPALAIIGLVTSILVFIALMTFIWISTFAANIVAIVYSFSVLCACTFVLVRYNHKKRIAEQQDEETGGSRLSLFGRSGGRGSRLGNSHDGAGVQPEMDMVQESEIVVIPRLPVHREVGDAEADPELPPYSRGNATEILDITSAPIPNR